MKLSNGNMEAGMIYPKFKNIGDKVIGKFVSYTPGVNGNYGLEDQLVLKGTDGQLQQVRCPAALANTINQNIKLFQPGVKVTIVFTDTKKGKKPTPMKLFDVDVEGDGIPSAESKDADEAGIPF